MIEAIFVSQKPREPLQQVDEVQVVAGAGITGDRHFRKRRYPGQNITFIARETIEQYNHDHGQTIRLDATRRNVLTYGVDLNALAGKEFEIGGALFYGVELCEPCSVLGKLLGNTTITPSEVIKAFYNKGGLRADIIRGGILRTGMHINVTNNKPNGDPA